MPITGMFHCASACIAQGSEDGIETLWLDISDEQNLVFKLKFIGVTFSKGWKLTPAQVMAYTNSMKPS